jgi:hypothetical protein
MSSTAAAQGRDAASGSAKRIRPSSGKKETFKALFLVVVPVAAFFWGRGWYDESYYTAEEGLGYWLGLVGGVLMLLAYIYSARKHVPGFRHISSLGRWLRIHIAFGIIGPFLIVPHTTFHFSSRNGTIAFIAMALVFLSGVIGRYLYSKVHLSLDGKKTELRELTQSLGLSDKENRSVLASIEPVRVRLAEYEKIAMKREIGLYAASRALVSTRIGGYALYWGMTSRLRQYLLPYAQQQQWTSTDLHIAERQLRQMLKTYIQALMTVSAFQAYDQLFVLWRMVHVPLLYLLFISGVLHVIYVHMY